jgi:hypothetical protein
LERAIVVTRVDLAKKKIRFIQMSVPHFRFIGGGLKMTGARRAAFEIDTPALPKPTAVVEVPTVAVEVPTAAPEPVAVVEVPTAAPSEVEAPAEVAEAAPEAGLVPENPPTE